MGKRRKTGDRILTKMARGLDDLAQYDDFCAEILPYLRGAVEAGTPAEEIYKKAEALAAARAVTIAARETDSGKALAAIKEILDRSMGKATERKVVEHKFAKLSDQELNAVLLTELQEADDESSE